MTEIERLKAALEATYAARDAAAIAAADAYDARDAARDAAAIAAADAYDAHAAAIVAQEQETDR